MKSSLLILLFLVSGIGFAQNNYIVKTEDGRRVLLKADFTWEYIDAESPKMNSVVKETPKLSNSKSCNLVDGFEEPKLDAKIQAQLKKGRATISHIKKKVAKDYNCKVEDVVLLSVSEKKTNGVYDFCANGTKVTYKRNGHNIAKKLKLF